MVKSFLFVVSEKTDDGFESTLQVSLLMSTIIYGIRGPSLKGCSIISVTYLKPIEFDFNIM